MPAGRRNFSRCAASLLRYQPEMSTAAPVVFRSSTQSDALPGVLARTSLITTAGVAPGPVVRRGVLVDARRAEARRGCAPGARDAPVRRRRGQRDDDTIESPPPSAVGIHASLYPKSRIVAFGASVRRICPPPSSSAPDERPADVDARAVRSANARRSCTRTMYWPAAGDVAERERTAPDSLNPFRLIGGRRRCSCSSMNS